MYLSEVFKFENGSWGRILNAQKLDLGGGLWWLAESSLNQEDQSSIPAPSNILFQIPTPAHTNEE